ncbi:MAG TPA: hypothetical protein VG269_14320 [Tepidisphaeraceae bacterium]|nr:hypothetical protein [Tepidisphaeraceae bacterium]
MSSGNTVYRFTDGGALLNSAQVDSANVLAQGLSFGPDGRLYAAISNGGNRVVSFDPDLSNLHAFVSEGQGGIFTPYGLAFSGGGDLYAAAYNQQAIDRYAGPNAATPGANEPNPGNSGAVFAGSTGNVVGLAFLSDNTLYTTRAQNNGEVDLVGDTGSLTPVAVGLGSASIGGVAVSPDGAKLFVQDANTVLRYTINADRTLQQDSFTLHYSEGTTISNGVGIAFGPDGALYETSGRMNNTANLPADSNTDWVIRIDPLSGGVTRFVTGGANSFNPSNTTFLTFSTPEPTTAAVLGMGLFGLLGRRPRRGSRPVV